MESSPIFPNGFGRSGPQKEGEKGGLVGEIASLWLDLKLKWVIVDELVLLEVAEAGGVEVGGDGDHDRSQNQR
jgi:hypothetical protein